MVTGAATEEGGVAHGGLLTAFAEAVIRGDDAALGYTRDALAAAVGADGLVDAAAVVATFNAIDRVADATGIPLDSGTARMTVDLRASLGIDGFAAGKETGTTEEIPAR